LRGMMGMAEKNNIESFYNSIEELERKKRWLFLVFTTCLVAAPAVLGLNVFAFTMFNHQKGGLSEINLLLIAVLAIICLGLVLIAINRYVVFRKLKHSMLEAEMFEKIIFKEVLEGRIGAKGYFDTEK
jgi:hypothetical protein